jgi:U6 snRNA-associated Sm-like protein LSm7
VNKPAKLVLKKQKLEQKLMQKKEIKKKEAILDLEKFKEQTVFVSFQGGRSVTGLLKGFDLLQNLVLDNVKDQNDRLLGLVVCRGTAIVTIAPFDGFRSIPNPF